MSDCNVKRVEYANIYNATAVLLNALNTLRIFQLVLVLLSPTFFVFFTQRNAHTFMDNTNSRGQVSDQAAKD